MPTKEQYEYALRVAETFQELKESMPVFAPSYEERLAEGIDALMEDYFGLDTSLHSYEEIIQVCRKGIENA
jgi:hypothetical protein